MSTRQRAQMGCLISNRAAWNTGQTDCRTALVSPGEKIGNGRQLGLAKFPSKSRHVSVRIDEARIRDPSFEPRGRVIGFLRGVREIGAFVGAVAIDRVARDAFLWRKLHCRL